MQEYDYYPFGLAMNGRSMSEDGYRFGFNGKENDDDLSCEAQDYGLRINNKALGRFLSVDPLTKDYPMLTSYQFASNSPIQNIDLDGAEAEVKTINSEGGGGTYLRVSNDAFHSKLSFISNYLLQNNSIPFEGREAFFSDATNKYTGTLTINYSGSWDKIHSASYTNFETYNWLERLDRGLMGNTRDPLEGNDSGVIPFEQGKNIMAGTGSVIIGVLTAGGFTATEIAITGLSIAFGVDDILSNKKGDSGVEQLLDENGANKIKPYYNSAKGAIQLGLGARGAINKLNPTLFRSLEGGDGLSGGFDSGSKAVEQFSNKEKKGGQE